MAPTASSIIETAHKAVRRIGGIGATLTFETGPPVACVIVSERAPAADAGLIEGMTDVTKIMECSVLVSERSTAPLDGELVTINESPWSGIDWHVMAGSISRTQGDHRFTLIDGPAS